MSLLPGSREPFVSDDTDPGSREPFVSDDTDPGSHEPFVSDDTDPGSREPFVSDDTDLGSHESFVPDDRDPGSHEPDDRQLREVSSAPRHRSAPLGSGVTASSPRRPGVAKSQRLVQIDSVT